jgi:DNA helicase II / ATP-dependent DNA helicase PcrA
MIPAHLIQNDAVESEAVNLKDLKKQIQKSIGENNEIAKEEIFTEETMAVGSITEAAVEVNESQVTIKQVIHKKYGTGKVLNEDDIMIEVEFENYGVKEFMNAFSELEFL